MRASNSSMVTEIRTVAVDGGQAGRKLNRDRKEVMEWWTFSVNTCTLHICNKSQNCKIFEYYCMELYFNFLKGRREGKRGISIEHDRMTMLIISSLLETPLKWEEKNNTGIIPWRQRDRREDASEQRVCPVLKMEGTQRRDCLSKAEEVPNEMLIKNDMPKKLEYSPFWILGSSAHSQERDWRWILWTLGPGVPWGNRSHPNTECPYRLFSTSGLNINGQTFEECLYHAREKPK